MPTMAPEGLISPTLFVYYCLKSNWGGTKKQDIVVSGFLLWFLMPHADPYIKMTEFAVIYSVYHCSPPIYSTVRISCCTLWTALMC